MHIAPFSGRLALQKSKSKKLPSGCEPAGPVLRGLEISLRTNTLSWVKEFVAYQPKNAEPLRHGGLDVLMKYFMNMDEEGKDDAHGHLCVLCLRALMNNAYGFTSVMAHPQTINQICGCLQIYDPFSGAEGGEGETEQKSKKYRTYVLVLELLAAVCLVPRGHRRVLEAFNYFKEMCNEKVSRAPPHCLFAPPPTTACAIARPCPSTPLGSHLRLQPLSRAD